jgi:hypothetical protein
MGRSYRKSQFYLQYIFDSATYYYFREHYLVKFFAFMKGLAIAQDGTVNAAVVCLPCTY